MSYLLAVLAGAIQGFTEFIPVSSSGHLVLFHNIFGFDFSDSLLFDVFLHLGTMIALIAFFYKEIIFLLLAFFKSIKHWNIKNDKDQRLAWMIIAGTVPAVIAGFFFESIIENYFHNSSISILVVAISLIAVGLLFFWVEKMAKKQKIINDIRLKDSLFIGIAQAIALIPGVSRSGITIIAGMARDFKREQAARFSFLLSIPIIAGAGLKSILSVSSWSDVSIGLIIVGFLTSALTGYIAIKFLLNFLSNHSLKAFAWYRLIIGLLILVWFFVR